MYRENKILKFSMENFKERKTLRKKKIRETLKEREIHSEKKIKK